MTRCCKISVFIVNPIRICLILAGMLWLGAIVVRADTHYVSLDGTNDYTGGYTNWVGAATQIQWAVAAATNNETVLVSNGTYYLTNQITVTNGITLQSLKGYALTTVDGGNYSGRPTTNRCFSINHAQAVVSGFTITNGRAMPAMGSAGGVLLSAGIVSNCYIAKNWSDYRGGGIVLSTTNNTLVSRCIISNNYANWGGGGVMFDGSGGTVSDCIIANNRGMASGEGGGGVYFYESLRGGILRNCLIRNNYQGGPGGGVCVWIDNRVAAPGIYNGCTIYNCTVVSNYSANAAAGVRGGGISIMPAPEVMVYNCIITSNAVSTTTNDPNVDYHASGTNYFAYCCTPSTNFMSGTSNITNNPQFIGWSSANYRLSANSPCVNTGTNASWMTNAVDLDGRMRIRYGRVDMGAYERIYDGSIYSVH